MAYLDNSRNNLRAEAAGDQIRAAIRDGEDEGISDHPLICAAAARTLTTGNITSPEFRAATESVLSAWAEEYNVDRPDPPNH